MHLVQITNYCFFLKYLISAFSRLSHGVTATLVLMHYRSPNNVILNRTGELKLNRVPAWESGLKKISKIPKILNVD